MQQNTRRRFRVGVWALTCWSAFQGGVGLTQGINTATATGTAFIFRAESANSPLSQLQVGLNRTIPLVPTENTVLGADAFGPVTVRSPLGDRQRLDRYVWSVDPTSRIYWGRSGYKSVVALYQYGNVRQALKYTLNVFCQTVNLANRDQAVCLLSGNGPLLEGDLRVTGALTLDTIDSGLNVGEPVGSSPSYDAALPSVEGIDLSGVQTVPGNSAPNPQIDQGIADAGYAPSTGVSRYVYHRIDLNGDGNPETIVYLNGPTACGTGGCTALVLQFDANGDRSRLVSRLTLANPPMIVSTNKTWGWRDLILYVSGGGATSGYRQLRFDGQGYPENPSTQPPLTRPTQVSGVALMGGDRPATIPPPPLFPSNPTDLYNRQAAYKRGYELGQLDAQQQLSRNYTRHRTEYEGSGEANFRQGYDNGYNNFSDARPPQADNRPGPY